MSVLERLILESITRLEMDCQRASGGPGEAGPPASSQARGRGPGGGGGGVDATVGQKLGCCCCCWLLPTRSANISGGARDSCCCCCCGPVAVPCPVLNRVKPVDMWMVGSWL